MNVLLLSSGRMRAIAQHQLWHALATAGMRVWIDWPIDLSDYRAQILSMMNEADLVVLLLDQEYAVASALEVEWSAAHHTHTRKLVVTFGVAAPRSSDSSFTYVACQQESEVVPAVVDFVTHGLQLRLFISYSHKNRRAVDAVASLARFSLSPIWIDKSDLSVGKTFPSAIEAAIESASRFLLVWSKYAAQSSWVEREWRHALASSRLIAPLLIDQTPLPTELESLHAFQSLSDEGLLDWISIPDAVRVTAAFRVARKWRSFWA